MGHDIEAISKAFDRLMTDLSRVPQGLSHEPSLEGHASGGNDAPGPSGGLSCWVEPTCSELAASGRSGKVRGLSPKRA